MDMPLHVHRWFSFNVEMIMSKLVKALVDRALRLQVQTSLESLAVELDEWYRQCSAEHCLEGWLDDKYIEPHVLAGYNMPEGWYYVGCGHFSLAVAHESRPDYIFKICCRTGDGYPEYATWCVSKFNDGTHVGLCIPHIPFVHRSLAHVRIVPVQRLREIHSGNTETSDRYDSDEELRDPIDVIQWYFGVLLGFSVYEDGYERDVPPKMKATVKAIVQSFKGLHDVDIHRGNVMLNDDGDMILTDPLGFADSVGTWRKTRRKHTK